MGTKYRFFFACGSQNASKPIKFGDPGRIQNWHLRKPPLVCPRSKTRGGFLKWNTSDPNLELSFSDFGPRPKFEVDHREFYFGSRIFGQKNVKVCTCLVLKKIIRCVAIDSSLLYRSAEKKSAQLPIVCTYKERENYVCDSLYSKQNNYGTEQCRFERAQVDVKK